MVLLIKKEAKKMRVIIYFIVLSFLCSGVFAISGVSPAVYEVGFEPGYSEEFVFSFVIGEGSADLYIEGDLAEFVSLNKKSVSGREEVLVNLDLPLVVDSPGVDYIKVGARNDNINVGGFIKINVPYPERYVEVGLNAPNVNVGEDILFNLELFGLGNESVVVSPRIEIYKDEEKIEVISVEDVEVSSGEKVIKDISLETEAYSAGNYLAIGFADYDDKSVRAGNPFRLGEFSVGLVDYTKYFRENKIDRFEILVESLWDDDMSDVYAEVNFPNFPKGNFVTSSESLGAWGDQILSGFLDVSEIEDNIFDAEIILYYGDESVSEIVELEIIKGFDWGFYLIILIIILILVFLAWRIFVFIKRFKKHKIKK